MDILELVNVTATTATFYLGDGERSAEGYTIELYDSAQTTMVKTAVTDANGQATFKGLTPETTYYGYYSAAGYVQARTTADEPKTATESQWMDLAERVKDASAGGIKTLTTADYDYHSSGTVDDGIALWKLPVGIYKVSSGMRIYPVNNERVQATDGFVLIGLGYWKEQPAITVKNEWIFGYSGNSVGNIFAGILSYTTVRVDTGVFQNESASASGYINFTPQEILRAASVTDRVISATEAISYSRYYGYSPLSARVGHEIDKKIGVLANLTTVDKTSTVAAINELVTTIGDIETALHTINNGGN